MAKPIKSMTYGTLPTYAEFKEQYNKLCINSDGFEVGFKVSAGETRDLFPSVEGSGLDCPKGCSRIYYLPDLWRLIENLTYICTDEMDQEAGQDACNILSMFGFEWI